MYVYSSYLPETHLDRLLSLGNALPSTVILTSAAHLYVQARLHVGSVSEELVRGRSELPPILQ